MYSVLCGRRREWSKNVVKKDFFAYGKCDLARTNRCYHVGVRLLLSFASFALKMVEKYRRAYFGLYVLTCFVSEENNSRRFFLLCILWLIFICIWWIYLTTTIEFECKFYKCLVSTLQHIQMNRRTNIRMKIQFYSVEIFSSTSQYNDEVSVGFAGDLARNSPIGRKIFYYVNDSMPSWVKMPVVC